LLTSGASSGKLKHKLNHGGVGSTQKIQVRPYWASGKENKTNSPDRGFCFIRGKYSRMTFKIESDSRKNEQRQRAVHTEGYGERAAQVLTPKQANIGGHL
jgi:hypothetical protein